MKQHPPIEHPSDSSGPSRTEGAHDIDVFISGGGTDGPPRYLPTCLTCDQGLSGVKHDYGVALAIASEHRESSTRT